MQRMTTSLLVSASVLLAGLAVTGILMFAFVESAEARNAGPHSVGSKLEVAISDTGRVIVRGAEVTEIAGEIIRVRTEWGASALSWAVETNDETAFVEKGGSGSALTDVSVGDYVSFSGQLDENESNFTVDADAVKNWSLEDDSRATVRVEAKAESKDRWNDWKKYPIFNWFTDKDDSR